jgi:thiol:disulfide interchange protein
LRKFLYFFLLLGFSSFSQEEEPILWNSKIEKISETNYLIVLEASIKANWHLYSQLIEDEGPPNPTKFIFKNKESYKLVGIFSESKSITEFDNLFEKKLTYFENKAVFTQEIKLSNNKLQKIIIDIEYQACDDKLCIFRTDTFTVFLNEEKIKESNTQIDSESILKSERLNLDLKNLEFLNKNDSSIKESSYIYIFFIGFIGGLLALLTPCVFPMIPLTVSYFLKQNKNRYSGIKNSFLYGFFIILIYALLSLPFHLFESLDPGILNTISTSVFVNLLFFIVFVFFAFSFFGFYELTLPSSWGTKTDSVSDVKGLTGVFFMALTLSIVSFSCTGPILGSLLVGSITNSDGPMQLTFGMLGFGFALGIPFSILSFFPNSIVKIPKSGPWMSTIKIILGFLELALALKFLSNADLIGEWNLLKREIFISLWALISLFLGFYLIEFIKFPNDFSFSKNALMKKKISIIPFLFSGFLIYSLFSEENKLKMLSGFPPPEFYTLNSKDNGCPLNLDCFKDFETGLEYAKINDKPILIDFTGWACVNCRRMEENVWSDSEIYSLLKEKYVLISLYVDDRENLPESDQFNLRYSNGRIKRIITIGQKWSAFQAINFNTASQPFYVQITTEGELLNSTIQYSNIKEFKKWLQQGLENIPLKAKFQL